MKIKERFKGAWQKIIRANASPQEIAMGVAIGLFTAMVPIVPVQTLLLLLLFVLIPKINKPAAYAVSWVMNQFTILPIYAFEFYLGSRLLGRAAGNSGRMLHEFVKDPSYHRFIQAGNDLILPLMLGGLVSAVVVSVLGYVTALYLASKHRKNTPKTDPTA